MKCLIMSDSHGHLENLYKIFKDDYDYLIHAGDQYPDFKYIQREYSINGKGVCGNVDTHGHGEEEVIFDLWGKKVLVTHGHVHRVNFGLNKLYYYAKSKSVDVVIFGHTHRRFFDQVDDILFINPGSIHSPRDGKAKSYVSLEVVDNQWVVKFKEIK